MEFAGPVVQVVLPVYALIGIGGLAARLRAIAAQDVQRFSRFTFVVFMPALLFRAVATADFSGLTPGVPIAYFTAALLVFAAASLLDRGRGTPADAVVSGLAASFSNTVMIGVPLVSLGWGADGLSVLLSIVALHAALMFTLATFAIEIATAAGAPARAAAVALRQALVHPVILPIAAGAAWRLEGVPLPDPLDAVLAVLAAAAVPLCLVLLGASLTAEALRGGLRPLLAASAWKLLAMPALAYVVGRHLVGLEPLPLSIVVVAAALPIGANVFLFAQRHGGPQAPIAAAVFVSTLLAAPLLALLLPLLPMPPR